MVQDFDLKLKVTILALGFATQKELYRRFLEVAPNSGLEQETFYKWIQGRSAPRSSTVYEHWAKMLQLDRPVVHLKSCSIDEFVDDMIDAYELDRAVVASVIAGVAGHSAAGHDPPDDPSGAWRRSLCGTFVCYSRAFSPIFKGKIMRGALVVSAPDPAERLEACYSEITPFTELAHRGRLSWSNRLVMLDLRDDRSSSHVHMTLHCPGEPASMLAGLMTGSSFHDACPQPTVTRFLAIRLPNLDLSAAGGRDCVFDVSDHSISAELNRLGLTIVRSRHLDCLIADFFDGEGQAGFDQVSADASARLNFAFDLELADAVKRGQNGGPSKGPVIVPFRKR